MAHDYDPEWDYVLQDVPVETRRLLDRIAGRIRIKVLPALGFDDIQVFFGELGGPLGIYVDGTSSRPVIGVDHDALVAGCISHGLSYEQQLAATILHEAGHAYHEAAGIEEHDEEAVEQFARVWALENRVDVSLLQTGSSTR